jgi:acyl carrier protein
LTPERSDRLARRVALLGLLAEIAPRLDGDLTDDTPLITSGVIESLALLSLVQWVEARIDSTVDITAFDLAAQWDTVSAILDFTERYQSPARRD